MIKLDVEEYCHECRAFEPFTDVVEVHKFSYDDPMMRTTIVRCENFKRCRQIEKYLRKQLEKEES